MGIIGFKSKIDAFNYVITFSKLSKAYFTGKWLVSMHAFLCARISRRIFDWNFFDCKSRPIFGWLILVLTIYICLLWRIRQVKKKRNVDKHSWPTTLFQFFFAIAMSWFRRTRQIHFNSKRRIREKCRLKIVEKRFECLP